VKNWLAVLFNVFASVERGERAQVREVIGVWAGVAGESELAGAYRSVLGTLTPPSPGSEPTPTDPSPKKRRAK